MNKQYVTASCHVSTKGATYYIHITHPLEFMHKNNASMGNLLFKLHYTHGRYKQILAAIKKIQNIPCTKQFHYSTKWQKVHSNNHFSQVHPFSPFPSSQHSFQQGGRGKSCRGQTLNKPVKTKIESKNTLILTGIINFTSKVNQPIWNSHLTSAHLPVQLWCEHLGVLPSGST